MLLLSEQERERFAAWLEQEAATSEAVVEQMSKLTVPQAFVDKERAEANAARIIARRLRATESVAVGRR